MSITGAIEGIGSIANLVGKIIDQLDTPEKRAKARREFLNELLLLVKKVDNEKETDAILQIIRDFMSAVDSR